jgi:fibro-slime domain-containing protein
MQRICAAVVFGAFFSLLSTAQGGMSYLTLTGRIYDLKSSHPNMEPTPHGIETGIVMPDLGHDLRPEFNPATTAVSVTNATDFLDWFHDTPNNMSDGFLIDLLQSSPGAYSFSPTAFLPIDDMLLGNEGNPHNYHFAVAVSMPFVYFPGSHFNVAADDDLWIFVDNELALDLGGAHPGATGAIDFDTLGLTPGESYELQMFFAQRHANGSSLGIDTNIGVPEPSTWALAVCGVVAAGFGIRKRRQH